MLCPRCNGQVEDLAHLLCSCPFSQENSGRVFGRGWNVSCNLLNRDEWWKILSGEVDGVGSVKEFRQGFIAYASWLLLYKSRKRFIFDGVEDNVTEVAKTVEMFSLGEDDQISHADERLWASWAFKSVYSQPYEPKLVK